jgi:hypothetical protein
VKFGILQLTAARRDTRKLLAKIAGLRFLLSPPCIAAGFSSSGIRLEGCASYDGKRGDARGWKRKLLNFRSLLSRIHERSGIIHAKTHETELRDALFAQPIISTNAFLLK